MNSWPPPLLKVCHSFLRVRHDDLDPTPSLLFARCHPFSRFFSMEFVHCHIKTISQMLWDCFMATTTTTLLHDFFRSEVSLISTLIHSPSYPTRTEQNPWLLWNYSRLLTRCSEAQFSPSLFPVSFYFLKGGWSDLKSGVQKMHSILVLWITANNWKSNFPQPQVAGAYPVNLFSPNWYNFYAPLSRTIREGVKKKKKVEFSTKDRTLPTHPP